MVTRVTRGWSIQMIICKRPTPPDDHLQEAGPKTILATTITTTGVTGGVIRVTEVTRGDRTEGGEEGKGEGEEGREEILAGGHMDGQTN